MEVGRQIAPGDVVGGYEIGAVAGRGGMGEVYRALDTRLERQVALKLLAERLSGDESFRERMLRESRLAASLDHPNVVPIYEAGEADGRLFIAMRYVEGTDLKVLLRREGALQPARALAIVTQVADALDAAHEKGLVHRDVKPSNVLLDQQGGREHVYLADFGLTQSASDSRPTDGLLMGTADYVAPEQIRGDDVDGRADVYALGCLLFETLTGTLPFSGASDVALVYAHLETEPPLASERVPGLPAAVDDVLRRAMAKDRDERQDTCRQLVDEAQAALGVVASLVPRRRPLLAAVTALALVVASLVGAVIVTREDVAPGAAGFLIRIDSRTGDVTERHEVSAHPGVIATGAGRVWVGDTREGTLWRLEPTSGELKRVISAGEPGDLTALAGKIYVTSATDVFTGAITRYDAITGVRERNLKLITCSVGAGLGFVWSCGAGNANRLSTDSGPLRVLRTIHLPYRTPVSSGRTRTSHADVAIGFGSVWILGDGLDRRLWRVHPTSGRVIATIELPSMPRTVAVGEGGVWITAPIDDAVLRVDPSTNRVTARIRTGRGTSGVAAGAGSVWVANTFDRTVSRIDPVTMGVVGTVDVGGRPHEVTVGAGGVWVSADAS